MRGDIPLCQFSSIFSREIPLVSGTKKYTNNKESIVIKPKIAKDVLLPHISIIGRKLNTTIKLKAKLGVALSVIYPDKVFSQFDKQLQMVDWAKSDTLSDCLSEVIKI